MSRPYKTILLFSAVMLSRLCAVAQLGDSSLVYQFKRYNAQNWQEKVFVHTDKSFYLAGEVLWFKTYVTDAAFNMPADVSKICYVEIISKDLKPVLQGKVEITAGSGNGSFTLPGFLATGNYILRAYTNWMKNLGPAYFFEKNITIVNPAKGTGPAAKDAGNIQAQFFPEGGQLVNGLASTIGFIITGANGAGVNGDGYVLNTNNDTVAHFAAKHYGLGHFSFTPQQGNTYKAVIAYAGKKITQQLPAAYNEGYVMTVANGDSAHIKISVASNTNGIVYLFVHAGNRFKAMLQQQISSGSAEFMVDKSTLADGITTFTVFNNSRQPVCERLYFKRPAAKLDIDITNSQPALAQRSKISFDIATHNGQAAVADADMSVSAFLVDSLQGIREPGILSYMLLTSGLGGYIEGADWYVNNNSTEAEEGLDDLMLTHGWRRLKWEDILANKKPYFKYAPETEGHLITGRVFDKASGLPAKNIISYLTVPGQQFKFAADVSNSEGQVMFNIEKFYGSNQVIAQTNTLADSNYRFDFVSPYADSFSNTVIAPLALQKQWRSQLEERTLNAQADYAYLRDAKQKYNVNAHADTTLFYGTADKTYYLDDYTRFTTMDEVMREFVTEVRVRKPSDYDFRVKMQNSADYFDKPLVLVDGVPVFNVNKVMETDPLKIKKIDIITHKYFSGPLISDGIISYCSYDGALGSTLLAQNGLVVDYDGLQREREFCSPMYDTPEKAGSRIPDARNVLYWSPALKTDAKGRQTISFYTSDVPGKYAVMVQGITPGGLAGSVITTFEVK